MPDPRFVAGLLSAGFRTALSRTLRGARRPGWTPGFEALAVALKKDAARTSRLPIAARRAHHERMATPSPVLRSVRVEPVSAGGVRGEWVAPTQVQGGPVLLYFHGGSYQSGSPRTHRELVARLCLASGLRAFSLDYRLAPEHPFPAAIDDALEALAWVEAQPGARGVLLGGDSAGGNLALATLLGRRERGGPLPRAAALLCPWVELECRSPSLVRNEPYDWGTPDDFASWAETYLAGHDPLDPLASPTRADLAGLPPLLVQVGGAEMLLDEVLLLTERARAAEVKVTLEVHEDMIHNWMMFASLGFEPSLRAIRSAGAFLAAHAGS